MNLEENLFNEIDGNDAEELNNFDDKVEDEKVEDEKEAQLPNPNNKTKHTETRNKQILVKWTDEQKSIVHEINMNLEENLFNEIDGNDAEELNNFDDKVEDEKVEDEKEAQLPNPNNKTKHTETRNKQILVKWTDEQKSIVRKYFQKHIRNKKSPKRLECEELNKKYPDILSNKNWLKIKVFIQNIYIKK
ncbi:hypothetical protein FQA39_LY18126 [Lamprigera yunnana]|nr:hypothetical protein FQA39_LY18126 [Lamprigera yunnana]